LLARTFRPSIRRPDTVASKIGAFPVVDDQQTAELPLLAPVVPTAPAPIALKQVDIFSLSSTSTPRGRAH